MRQSTQSGNPAGPLFPGFYRSPMTDAPDWDAMLDRGITAREKVDAILESTHLAVPEAVDALQARYEENQSTFPHVVVTTVMVSKTPGGEPTIPHMGYIGPFDNKQEATEWATATFRSNSWVTFDVARIDTPTLFERHAAQMRAIAEGRKPDS